jgi:hypothetical protein
VRLIVALLLGASPALAADWGHYGNARFGYGVDVPPGFVAQGESDNGDGQVFSTPTATLTVYGGHVIERDFEAEVRAREADDAKSGWGMTYKSSSPQNASYSGKKGARILYVRLVALCKGTDFAAFELSYSRIDIPKFDAVINRLVRSLRGTGGGASCG